MRHLRRVKGYKINHSLNGNTSCTPQSAFAFNESHSGILESADVSDRLNRILELYAR